MIVKQDFRCFVLGLLCILIVFLSVPLPFWRSIDLKLCTSKMSILLRRNRKCRSQLLSACLQGQWSYPDLEKVAMHFHRRSAFFGTTQEGWNQMLPSGGHLIHQGHLDGSVSTHTVAVFHQLQCLNTIRQYHAGDPNTPLSSPLVSHCLNYLRETVLCQMDMREEQIPDKPLINGFDRMCIDWEAVWKDAETNYEKYQEYLRSAGR